MRQDSDRTGENMEIRKRLLEMQDEAYADFQHKLTPTVPRELLIGVRVPELRKLAKIYIKEKEAAEFMQTLPHYYYDENMLHGILLSEIKDYRECVAAVDAFLPYVDNWAVCDTMSPKVFKKHRQELILKIREWIASDHVYTCRFGMKMLMGHFLDEDFKAEYLELPEGVHSDEYYVNMMIAWYFATALAKQWEATIPYIVNKRLDIWVHNKTIQKARESKRITDEKKEYLKGLK